MLSAKLKDLGVQQYGQWGYFRSITGAMKVHSRLNTLNGENAVMCAFTVAELGDMLPDWVYSKKDSNAVDMWSCMIDTGHVNLPDKWKPDFKRYPSGGKSIMVHPKNFCADKEADARALMLIFLLEEKVLNIGK